MAGAEDTAPHLKAPIIDMESARMLCQNGYAAIYCETISGNPLNASNVVRWVLNRPGLLGGDDVYAPSEQVYTYSDVFTPYIKNRIAGKLYMPTIDKRIFHCDNTDLSERTLECFYVGKSEWKDGFVDRNRVFEITRTMPLKSELGKLLRASRVLYCFDNSTILIYEALFCGCPVVVIPDATQTKQDFQQLELGSDGIAWGPAEFDGAPVDLKPLQSRYACVKRQFVDQLDQMVRASDPGLAFDPQVIQRLQPETSWYEDVFVACKSGAQVMIRHGRKVETAIRRLRKYCMRRIGLATSQSAPSFDESDFYCTNGDLSKRPLECYFVGQSRWIEGLLDRACAVEISPDMPGPQLAKLFRAAHRFYSFDVATPLVQLAARCGCPVIVVGKRGRLNHVQPYEIQFTDQHALCAT
jgi:hypothetical protein